MFRLALCVVGGLLPSLFLGASAVAADDSGQKRLALVAAAIERTSHKVWYDGSYQSLAYPMGDVPDHLGVCTDVVVRAYRSLGVDLQELVHEDMKSAFAEYPTKWGLRRPDPNIDHRRVPNLRTFLRRHGRVLASTHEGKDYRPGDLVTWMLPGNLPHIGIVAIGRSDDGLRPLIIHNIGAGPVVSDCLFDYPITGHYEYLPFQVEDSRGIAIGPSLLVKGE